MTVSSIIRFNGDLDAMVAEARAFEAEGLDLGIVSIPKNVDPAAVTTIAEALAPLA